MAVGNDETGPWSAVKSVAIKSAETYPLPTLIVVLAAIIILFGGCVWISSHYKWKISREGDRRYALDAIKSLNLPDAAKAAMIAAIINGGKDAKK